MTLQGCVQSLPNPYGEYGTVQQSAVVQAAPVAALAPPSQSPPTQITPPRPRTIKERCADQAGFFAHVVALRQSGASASFVYGMTTTGYIDKAQKYPMKDHADQYRKLILAIYDKPRFLFSDPSADGMRYEDACNEAPGTMLIGE